MSYKTKEQLKESSPYRKEIEKLRRKESRWVSKEREKIESKCKHKTQDTRSAGPIDFTTCWDCGKTWHER